MASSKLIRWTDHNEEFIPLFVHVEEVCIEGRILIQIHIILEEFFWAFYEYDGLMA